MAAAHSLEPIKATSKDVWSAWEHARGNESYFEFALHMAQSTNTSCGGRRHSKSTVVSCPWPGPPTFAMQNRQTMSEIMDLCTKRHDLDKDGVDTTSAHVFVCNVVVIGLGSQRFQAQVFFAAS